VATELPGSVIEPETAASTKKFYEIAVPAESFTF
jgi:hypothetical protein